MEDFYSQRDLPSETLYTSADLITSAPLIYDNDYVLVVATNTHIKLFSLLDKITECSLQDPPLKVLPYVFEGKYAIAVAFSNYVAVYEFDSEELHEVARYNLQYPPTSEYEAEIFKYYIEQQITSADAAMALKELMKTQSVSYMAYYFVSLPDPSPGEPQSPQYQQFYGLKNRARLLDGFTHRKDEITAFSVVDCSDNALKTFTGQCIVLGTANNLFYIIKSDFSEPLLTLFLDRYMTPTFIQMEGVISHQLSVAGKMQIGGVAAEKNDATNYSWRATILTYYGTVLSIRNGYLSANRIETDSTPLACYRLNKSIFVVLNSPYPASVQKLSVRGRIEMYYELYAEYKQLVPVEIILGRPFNGFLLLLRQNHILFMGENGPSRHIYLYVNAQIDFIKICRISTSDTAMVCVYANGSVGYKLIKKTADFSSQRGVSTQEYIVHPFDVESIDNADERFKPFPLEVYQRIVKEFLPARAAARNIVLQELLTNAEKGIEAVRGLDFSATTLLEGAGPAFQLVINIKNVSKYILPQMSCNIISPLLKAEREAFVVPSVAIGCDVEVSIALVMRSMADGRTVDAHEVVVEIGDDGYRALWTGVVCIPEFIC